MASSEFSTKEIPFYTDNVYALRVFKVDNMGRLYSPAFTDTVFRPGVNTAHCAAWQRSRDAWEADRAFRERQAKLALKEKDEDSHVLDEYAQDGETKSDDDRLWDVIVSELAKVAIKVKLEQLTFSGKIEDLRAPTQASLRNGTAFTTASIAVDDPGPEEDHVAATTECSCGFYAYHDEAEHLQYFEDRNSVIALIRASGKIIVGSKGMRCAKLEIIGIAVDCYDKFGIKRRGISPKLMQAVMRNYPDIDVQERAEDLVDKYPLWSEDGNEVVIEGDPTSEDFWGSPVEGL